MRFVCISDTHQLHKELEMPAGDVLIHAGDFTNMGRSKEIKKFNGWLGKLDYQYKIIIAGNHDIMFEREPDRAKRFITNAIYLRDEDYIIPYGDTNIKIHGSPWSTPFYSKHWVFNAERGEEIKEHWDKIDTDVDILVTHGPPFGYGDRVERIRPAVNSGDINEMNEDFAFSNNGRVGCMDLAHRVRQIKPRLHLFGHIHEDHGEWRDEHTVYANLSCWNHHNNTLRQPVIFDWDVDI